MTGIQILLLGPPEARLKGELITLQSRFTRALLFYLAERGGPVREEEVLSTFWGSLGQAEARQMLSVELAQLRDAFSNHPLLADEPGMAGINTGCVYVDSLEFQNLVDRAGRLPWRLPEDRPLPERAYSLLQRAAALWREPRFLAGADFPSTPGLDAWMMRTGQHAEHLYSRVLARLADHAYAAGSLEESLRYAQQALARDEMNEELHYRLLRCLVSMGRDEEARRYFASLQALLRRELDAGPGPKLVELYRQIRSQEGRSPKQQGISQPHWNLRPSVSAPFVGRAEVLEQLHAAWQHSGGAAILGESGQGKTRLLQEFAAQIQPPRLLLSTCRPAENNLPFQPVIELLRYHIQPDEWLALPSAWASQLAVLLPELFTIHANLERPLLEFAPEAAPGQARLLLLEAIRQVFLLIAGDRLLLCVDDAQWIDEASLTTLAYLLERPPFTESALLLVAARGEEMQPRLEALLASLQDSGRAAVIRLDPLSYAETGKLAGHVSGSPPSPAFTRQLQGETGGNPLFILETLRALLEHEPQADLSRPLSLPLPGSLQTLFRNRLGRLRPATRRVLEAAAVTGIVFDAQILPEVCQQKDVDMVRALEELQEAHLVEPATRPPEDVCYRFIHSKIREVLLQETNPMRLRLLHGAVARALARRLGAQAAAQSALLAEHYEQAGEPEAAFAGWVEAGRHARQLLSPAEATQAFARAERLIAQAPGLSDEALHGLYSEWMEAAYEAEDAATIERLSASLLEQGSERDSRLLTGAALNGLSDARMVRNQFEEGLKYSEQAIVQLELTGNIFEHMEAYNNRGVFLYMLNRIEEAVESFQDALAIGADSSDPPVLRARANAHYQIAIAQILRGWPELGLSHAGRSLADFIAVNRAYGQVGAYSALALSRYFMGQFSQARQDCQAGIDLAERIQAWRMLGYLHGYFGLIELSNGNTDAAIQHAEQAIMMGGRFSHSEMAAGGYRILGDIFYVLQAHEQAAGYYRLGRQAGQNQFLAVDQLVRLGASLSMCGQPEEGRACIQEAVEQAQAGGLGVALISARMSQAHANLIQGQFGRAYQMATALVGETRRRSLPASRLMIVFLLGMADEQAGEIEKAIERFQTAASEAACLPDPWIEQQSQAELGRLLAKAGRPDPAPLERARFLMNYLDEHARHPLVRQAFLSFRQRIESRSG